LLDEFFSIIVINHDIYFSIGQRYLESAVGNLFLI